METCFSCVLVLSFRTIVNVVLDKVPKHDYKLSYAYDQYCFHYAVEDGTTMLCMADEAYGRQLPFKFLEDIHQRWKRCGSIFGQAVMKIGIMTPKCIGQYSLPSVQTLTRSS